MSNVRVGIIGYGYAGRVMHARLIRAADGLDLAAVATRDNARREQAVRDWGVRTYATADELLADPAIDLVIVATPNDLHRDLCIRALEAGKHVVTDKPMALDAAEADAMIAAAKRTGRMLSVFQNRRWDGDYLTLNQVLADGLLGELLTVESTVVNWAHPSAERWRSHAKHGGGFFRDWGAHLLDQALALVPGRVEAVACDMLHTEPGVEVETYARCVLRFDSGVRCTVETGCISPIPRARWYVRGTQGAFQKYGLDPQEDALRAGVVSGNLPQPEEQRALVRFERDGAKNESVQPTIPGNWPAYYQNIADHLLRGRDLAVKPEEVRRVLALTDTAFESARQGAVVACRI